MTPLEIERSTLRLDGEGRPNGTATPADDLSLVEALRRGDEAAFVALVDCYHASMLRVAMLYVPNRTLAEDVVQEAWLGVLRGLDRFEARSSLKTWIFRIVMNRARTRAEREARSVPFSAFQDPEAESAEAAVSPDRFRAADPWQGHWASPPRSWSELPEDRLLSKETAGCIDAAVQALPPTQREVITLRDIEGWTSTEVCNALEISETNQRVLLHRARSKVRRALECYLDGE
jgi:RNA polymerase sigma-70 factor, ECF subfamily